jgi:CheY-like chemotaxis protein
VGDPVRLRQVLLNILSNAVKFTNAGGMVKISATAKGQQEKSTFGNSASLSNDTPLSSSAPLTNGEIIINFEIKDSGIGMNLEQIAKISEPFTQAEAGITRKYGGTGLGLAISRNIIQLMGGRLTIESTLGIGSKLSFELTFITIDTPMNGLNDEQTATNRIKKPHFNGEVLICEDNQMNQQMLCDHLERVGLKIDIAENGLAGLKMVHKCLNKDKKPYDLIFMDIHMPVMDGIEAASKIDKLGTGTPIVALTANVMSHDIELYLKNGMKDCVGKPFVS